MTLTPPMRCLVIGFFTLATGLSATVATAATTNYLVTGQLGASSSGDAADLGLDGSTFELRVTFDESTQPDPDRSTFATPTLTYLAQAWSLAYFRDSMIVAETSSESNPEALGFATLSGRLTGPDSGETFLSVGVEAGPVSDDAALLGSLILAEFTTPILVDAFFTNQLADVPGDVDFAGGSAFDASRDLFVGIAGASFAVSSIDDGIILGSPGENNGPSAIPTPSAAAGGALLLMGLLGRRRRAAANQA